MAQARLMSHCLPVASYLFSAASRYRMMRCTSVLLIGIGLGFIFCKEHLRQFVEVEFIGRYFIVSSHNGVGD